MKKIIKNILPPFMLFLLKKIYFLYLLNKNKLSIKKDIQDIEIYNDPITRRLKEVAYQRYLRQGKGLVAKIDNIKKNEGQIFCFGSIGR
jgi:hypothetical protein